MSRTLALLAMGVFGLSVYFGLGALRSNASRPVAPPNSTHAARDPGGTIYVAQAGALYRLKGSNFTRLNPGVAGQWMQPVVSPDHTRLLAVDRAGQSSDLYLLDLDGKVLRKLTDDAGAGRGAVSHWAFYPRWSPDGAAIFYGYDAPKFNGDFRVDMAIWSMALNGAQRLAHRMSTFNDYTGGDSFPIPLASGGLLYAKYSIGADGPYSEIWFQARSLSVGKALTTAKEDCGQPALSPDGSEVAMICTGGRQTSALVVAAFQPTGTLGTPTTLVEGVQAGSPAWSPDGRTVAYIAPDKAQGHFQLWTVAVPTITGSPSATTPRQVTVDLDLDATSPPAWM
jgi:dipeptidyl aminopeptidase/acylaminoacyl peptidase